MFNSHAFCSLPNAFRDALCRSKTGYGNIICIHTCYFRFLTPSNNDHNQRMIQYIFYICKKKNVNTVISHCPAVIAGHDEQTCSLFFHDRVSLSLSLSLLFLSLSFFIFLRILKCLWGLVHECQHWFECLQGENLPYKHGVFMEYRWCSHIAESCCRLSATYTEQSSREMKSGGTGERPETATGIAERKAL